MTKETNLAIYGGKPLRSRPWPQWPVVGKETERVLIEVLNSGRWAVSGPYTGQPSFERKFAESFATYWCPILPACLQWYCRFGCSAEGARGGLRPGSAGAWFNLGGMCLSRDTRRRHTFIG